MQKRRGWTSAASSCGRTLFLYLIGLTHGLLFWHNDILQAYAICGALLLPLVRTTDRTILATALVALISPLVFTVLGVVCLLAWLWTGRSGRLLANMFAPVGRMALTDYVGQSAICVLIFRGVGLGPGGTTGPTLYLPLGMAIYLFQLVASRVWRRWFQYGPLEWLWRMLTYGAAVPLHKVQPLSET